MAFDGEITPISNSLEGQSLPDVIHTTEVSPELAAKLGDTAINKDGKTLTEPFSSSIDPYMRWDISKQASALERTDLSNPKLPFFDF